MEVFLENDAILNSLSDEQIQFFIDLPRKSGRLGRYMGFLCSIVSIGEEPIAVTQKYIVGNLLERSPELLLSTIVCVFVFH